MDRTTYWVINENGFLISCVYLTEKEIDLYDILVTEEPPEESYEQRARWHNNMWELITVAPFPVTVSSAEIEANGIDICILSNIPSGTRVVNDQQEIVADGSNIEFVTDIPGKHTFKLVCHPFLDGEVIVNAI